MNMIKKFILKKIPYYIYHFFYSIGYFSEIIIVIIVLSLLYKNIPIILFYLIGLFINIIINYFLKIWIHEKRPNQPIPFFAKNHFNLKNSTYGMPSGHTENVFYSIVFLYMNFKKITIWIIISILIGIITIFQRLKYNNHTLFQLLVGSIIGSIFAYIFYQIYFYFYKESIKIVYEEKINK